MYVPWIMPILSLKNIWVDYTFWLLKIKVIFYTKIQRTEAQIKPLMEVCHHREGRGLLYVCTGLTQLNVLLSF